jgi:hypothetical protein
VGGAENTVDLMERNNKEYYFSEPENVITVLDGDKAEEESFKNNTRVLFTPFQSIEKELKLCFDKGLLDCKPKGKFNNHKRLYNALISEKLMTKNDIFEFLNDQKLKEVSDFNKELLRFLAKE